MTSLRRMAGEVCRTLYTVLSRVLQASLWNTMITLVVGKGGHLLNVCSIHLQRQEGGQKEHKDLTVFYSSWETRWSRYSMCRPFPRWGVRFTGDRACVAGSLSNVSAAREEAASPSEQLASLGESQCAEGSCVIFLCGRRIFAKVNSELTKATDRPPLKQ